MGNKSEFAENVGTDLVLQDTYITKVNPQNFMDVKLPQQFSFNIHSMRLLCEEQMLKRLQQNSTVFCLYFTIIK
ncbi:unnamed protein product [Paramecium sonneborni]|uniref:Uncharacterized protein n=1 Tax=Paramecium sonneborni TaxID=65129 RepID=A0A8S1MLT1_9CILI|nr:unnamed protein product [Paramecium sonneborni]